MVSPGRRWSRGHKLGEAGTRSAEAWSYLVGDGSEGERVNGRAVVEEGVGMGDK